MKTIVHYSEIGIKGRNKPAFEEKLVSNIMKRLEKENVKFNDVRVEDDRIVCDINDDKECVEEILSDVFGMQNFAIAEETNNNEADVVKKAVEFCKKLDKSKKKIALLTKVGEKNSKLKANEINKKIEEEINKLGMKVDFENPDEKLSIEITSRKAYFHTKKIDGLGGLPVGTSGKVLVLLSGGIDSAVAAWLMMKRGCEVDYLHFHTFEKNEPVLKTKIKGIIEILNKHQEKAKLFLVPYHNFQISTLGKTSDRTDVVVFKNFMLKLSQETAEKNRYPAIVTGDNLAQVASQTLDNIRATDSGVSIPILRPLLTYDKQEIINLAKKIRTYEETIKEYKDCCSIIAVKPDTSVSANKMKTTLSNIDMKKIIEKSISEMKSFDIQ